MSNWRSQPRGGRWQRGGGPSSRGRDENHHPSHGGKKPCRFFQKTGSCHFGSKCKFSHDADHDDQATPKPSHDRRQTPRSGEEAKDAERYNNWKYLLKRSPRHFGISHASSSQLYEVWSTAMEILNDKNPEWHQQLARDLVDDRFAGCEYVHLTLQTRITPSNAVNDLALIKAFLHTVTHAAILDCLSIDTPVGTLYNIISGAGGERAVPFFLHVCKEIIKQTNQGSGHYDVEEFNGLLIAILDALNQLLLRERRASFHDDIPDLLDQLDQVSTILDAVDSSNISHTYRAKKDRLSTLRKLVGLSNGLLKDSSPNNGKPNPLQTTGIAPSLLYPLEMPTPGGSHDNDHMAITDISIVPTAAELLSNEAEYLPSTDFHQPHFLDDPVRRYLDTHFRLLRHDVFGPLKAALSPALLCLDDNASLSKLSRKDVGLHIYQNAFIAHVSVHDRRGFEVHLTFDLPHQVRKKTKDERRRWWDASKRLEPGSLISLLATSSGDSKSPLLFIVSEKCSTSSNDHNQQDADGRTATVIAKLASLREDDLLLTVQRYRNRAQGAIIGIPGLIPATFTPILKNLQTAISTGDLPFSEWTIPRISGGPGLDGQVANPMPPRYALQGSFTFDLSPICREEGRKLTISASASSEDGRLIDQLEVETTLDRGQCQALVYALTREFALIQGPPGTGKSYLGVKLLQVLLTIKEKAHLGPIIIICYTNHALDQFLCHLLDVGIKKIIRIGGQSKTPQLEGYNLRTVSERVNKTRNENYLIGSTYSNLEEQLKSAGGRLGTIHKLRKGSAWEALEKLLKNQYPRIYRQVYFKDEDGFEVVGRDPLEVWVYPQGRGTKSSELEPDRQDTGHDIRMVLNKANQGIHSLSLKERKRVLFHLLDEIERQEVGRLLVDIEATEDLRHTVDMAHREVNRRALLTADVIGITTTGLAKDTAMLRNLRSKVVVCEEAGEVLEAHVISAMMPGVEHFIQIGDHQQLRPQINNYSLSLESKQGQSFQLDRSQFERLAVGQPGLSRVPVAQLNIQRRMRPEVSRLIRPLYPALRDHGSVLELPNVVGMRENVFWLNHEHAEDGAADDGRVKSHSNAWEVGMTKALVRHLVRQGVYKGSDIAVLTPYSGQLHKLREALHSDFDISLSDRDEDILATEGFELDTDSSKSQEKQGTLQKKRLLELMRLATVDNFQGEEAKVIIVSLVRSNAENKVGFLRTVNRINVLLSRAQHGMYLIGSADTYSKIPMWVDVQEKLEEVEAVGEAFNLCCPRHKDTPIRCAEPEDFLRSSPEGGCSLACEWRLDKCGHQCLAKCHSAAMHSAFLCPRSCPRHRSTCDHACPKMCGEDCGPCQVLVDDVDLPCGHIKDAVRCFKTLDKASIRCTVPVMKRVPECGHRVTVPCYTKVDVKEYRCPDPCNHALECGHVCSGTCGTCTTETKTHGQRTIHQICKKKCERPHNTCNHLCSSSCHTGIPCPPCPQTCDVLCAHSRCALSCSDPCAPCIEKCAWSCEHKGSCSMPCAAPCNRLPCDERCPRTLDCGHRCPGLCGEPCPEAYCQICSTKGEARVDLLEFKTYSEIDLDETPIVALSCGHFFTAESLDGLVSIGEVYTVDKTGAYNGLQEPNFVLAVPKCPDCKRPVKQYATRRYNRVVNSAVMDETSKRFLVKGRADLQELEEKIDLVEGNLQNKVQPNMKGRLKDIFSGRYRELYSLVYRANRFCKSMGAEQQPARKLFDAILEAKDRQPLDERLASLSLGETQRPVPEFRVILGGRLAYLRVQDIVLQDQLGLFGKSEGEEKMAHVDTLQRSTRAFLTACEAFITDSATQKLFRYAILGSISYARIAKGIQASLLGVVEDKDPLKESINRGRELLDAGEAMCDNPFEGAQELKKDVEHALRLFGREWFEPVTAEEIAAIKSAMVSGRGGLATHSGHWYRCENGHVFAIGECGMPMQLARCPECGASIGGRNHEAVAGVSRAMEMED